jgi:hypothetical protein
MVRVRGAKGTHQKDPRPPSRHPTPLHPPGVPKPEFVTST